MNHKRKVIIYVSVLFLILIVFAAGAGTISTRVADIARNLSSRPSLVSFSVTGCRSLSVSYEEGVVDASFGVSPSVFADAVREAEGIWEKGSGDDLFIRKDGGEVAINLIFDERQEETNRLKELLGSIETQREKFDALKAEYESMISLLLPVEGAYLRAKEEYESLVEELNSTIGLYNLRKKEYEEDVAYWNERGGAPKKEYDRLVKEYDDVRILYNQISMREVVAKEAFAVLEEKTDAYNLEAGKVNTVGGILSRIAAGLNEDASSYNRIQGDRDEFVTGLYSVKNGVRKIDVYQFYDYRELVIVLAHEMGHALGLGHASDPASIMYPKIGEQSLELSAEDISMLKELCSER